MSYNGRRHSLRPQGRAASKWLVPFPKCFRNDNERTVRVCLAARVHAACDPRIERV
jgi:hypothetical protein